MPSSCLDSTQDELLLCPILLSNPHQKSKTEMYFLSCLVLHLRCCFPLEALCVVGRQAFPPLSYILYPRFLSALAVILFGMLQFQRTQSGLPNQGTQRKALWASVISSCFIFHYSVCSLPARTIHYSNTYANIFKNHYADIICPYGTSVPATLQTRAGLSGS